MESFLQCLPILTTCLPLQEYKNRNKTKIIFYKNIFKIFKQKKKNVQADDKIIIDRFNSDAEEIEESTKKEFEPENSLEENTNFPILYTNMRNCPCKICEMKNLFQ